MPGITGDWRNWMERIDTLAELDLLKIENKRLKFDNRVLQQSLEETRERLYSCLEGRDGNDD